MRMTGKILAIAACAFAFAGSTATQAMPFDPGLKSNVPANVEHVFFRGGGRFHAGGFRGGRRPGMRPGAFGHGTYHGGYARRGYGYRGGYAYRGGYRYGRYGYAAGAAGLAAGAVVGGAIASGAYAGGNAASSCAARYRSYDPASGTFMGSDGLRHPCP